MDKRMVTNSVEFLLKASEALPNNLAFLKSYYTCKGIIQGLTEGIQIPPKFRCERCCLNYVDYPPVVTLKPPKKVDRFTNKLLRKSDKNEHMTAYQRKRAECLKNINCTIVSKVCRICHKEEKAFIEKPPKPELIDLETPIKTKKKKCRKDKFCGLAENAVLNSAKLNKPEDKPTTKLNAADKLQEPKIQSEVSHKKKKKEVIKQKTTKEKIIERKKSRTIKQLRKTLNKMLGTQKQSNRANNLKSFLSDL